MKIHGWHAATLNWNPTSPRVSPYELRDSSEQSSADKIKIRMKNRRDLIVSLARARLKKWRIRRNPFPSEFEIIQVMDYGFFTAPLSTPLHARLFSRGF